MSASRVIVPSAGLETVDDEVRASGCETLVDLLRFRAGAMPDRVVYRFIPGENKAEQRITYRQLDRRARSIAARIHETAESGARALLLIPPGLD